MSEERQTVKAEGSDIEAAVKVAAQSLGVSEAAVDYQVDKDWFRNEHGGAVPRSTVQIVAWERDGSLVDACDEAVAWLTELLQKMDVAAEIRGALDGMNVTLFIKAEKPGVVVGKGGKTIDGIRHLMEEAVGADHPDMGFRIKVADDRERDDRGGRDRDRGGRDRDRGGRDRGGRDRDRGGRDRDRGGRDRDRGGRDRGGRDRQGEEGHRTTDSDAKALERMAQKIANRVLESGQPEEVRRKLNSYDRRIIHTAIAEIEGVTTRSIGEGSMKSIEVRPESGASAEA